MQGPDYGIERRDGSTVVAREECMVCSREVAAKGGHTSALLAFADVSWPMDNLVSGLFRHR